MTTKPKSLSGWISAIVVAVVMGGGIFVAVAFVKTRPEPQKEEEVVTLPLVDFVVAEASDESVKLQLNGQVQPSRQIVLIPEVGGRVVWQNKQLVPGGMIDKGEAIVRIDPRDYSLAVKQQEAQLSSQKLSLTVEEKRRSVAEREWELFQKEREEAGLPASADDTNALARRRPYVKSAKVGVTSAKSGLSRAKLALSKTVITAPFNAFVRSEAVEKGQLVSPGMQLATLVGTDTFWVQVSVPIDKLSFIRLPNGKEKGSAATVTLDIGSEKVVRPGRVIRLLGDLDPVGRLARVIVEVRDPFTRVDSEGNPGGGLPLLLGSFVQVEIDGIALNDVLKLPRTALQENSKVYRLSAEDKLEVLPVVVVWGTRDWVMIRGKVKAGDRLISSPMAAPVEGMSLRVNEAVKEDKSAAKAETK